MSALDEIVKAYDIRGTVPDQLDTETARALGVGFARFANSDAVVVARDMRESGVELAAAFTDGLMSRGVDVIDIGLASTDLLYFASGSLDLPGAMFTASHNPAHYNGIKLCLAGAAPIGIDTGLAEIRATASTLLDGGSLPPATVRGSRSERDMLDGFVEHVLTFVDVDEIAPLRVVADTANGMGGLVVPAVLDRVPQVELDVLYGELDGTFPNHAADPLQPVNQRDLRARVNSGAYDVGLAFDGDADRVFVVDETGAGMSGSTTTALLATAMLRSHPGASVLHNLICSRAVPEVVREHGGVPIRTKVGHSNIKRLMADTGAVFGGEHSAHYYFARNYRADSGLIASMLVLAEMSRAGEPLSVLRKPFERYAASGEINTQVDAPDEVIERLAVEYAAYDQDRLDGLSVDCGDHWFNVRPSNTEPLLRLNLEAVDRSICDDRVAALLASMTAD